MKRTLLAVLCGTLCLSAQGQEAKSKAGHDVIFLADSRPVLVRLHVQLDGKSLVERWNGFITDLFKQLDKNKDGTLDRAEATTIPSPSELFVASAGRGFRPAVLPGASIVGVDPNNDGKVTRDELADYYANKGGSPLSLVQGNGDNEAYRRRVLGFSGQQPEQGQAEAINKALFAALDVDKDGKLSRQELVAAVKPLMKKDADDDEILTSAELRGEAGVDYGYQVVVSGLELTTPLTNGLLLEVKPTDAYFTRTLARTLIERYGRTQERKMEGKLSASDLGLDEAIFKQLDKNKDGKLDEDELGFFARRAPDAEVSIALGGKEGVAILKEFSGLKKENDGSLALQVGNTLLNLKLETAQPTQFAVPVANEDALLKMQFAAVDTDGNGYLDETEARRGPFNMSFKAMDADGDGKLYLKEMLAWFAARKELRDKANAVCVTLALSDQGKGVFDLLDTDRDGRLSVRELRNAPRLLRELDHDEDGALSVGEVPRRFQVGARRGPANSGFGDRVVAFAGRPGVARPAPTPTRGPLWFRKMDRNRDGDVSRREFLGTDEQFRVIDDDGDGLIDSKEAEAYDEKMRDKQ